MGVYVATFIAAAFAAGFTGYLAWLGRDQETRQLRAYVGLTGDIMVVCASCGDDKAPTDGITVEIENGGQTPAYYVSGSVAETIVPSGSSLSSSFPFTETDVAGGSIAMLSPGQRATMSFGITVDYLRKGRAGIVDLYFYGHFAYEDVFGFRHRTDFCLLREAGQDVKHEQVKVCDRHNSAD